MLLLRCIDLIGVQVLSDFEVIVAGVEGDASHLISKLTKVLDVITLFGEALYPPAFEVWAGLGVRHASVHGGRDGLGEVLGASWNSASRLMAVRVWWR
jgi:hypothetical protein